jgi:hypothetical protein
MAVLDARKVKIVCVIQLPVRLIVSCQAGASGPHAATVAELAPGNVPSQSSGKLRTEAKPAVLDRRRALATLTPAPWIAKSLAGVDGMHAAKLVVRGLRLGRSLS